MTPWKFKPNMSKGPDNKAPLFLSPRLLGTKPCRFILIKCWSWRRDKFVTRPLIAPKEICLPDDLSTSAVEASYEHEVGRGKIHALAERGRLPRIEREQNESKFPGTPCRKTRTTGWSVVESAYRIVHDQSVRIHGSIFNALGSLVSLVACIPVPNGLGFSVRSGLV